MTAKLILSERAKRLKASLEKETGRKVQFRNKELYLKDQQARAKERWKQTLALNTVR
jgi:hypothetical protein